jgi:hypothetical protein
LVLYKKTTIHHLLVPIVGLKMKVMEDKMTEEKAFNIDPSWKGVIK